MIKVKKKKKKKDGIRASSSGHHHSNNSFRQEEQWIIKIVRWKWDEEPNSHGLTVSPQKTLTNYRGETRWRWRNLAGATFTERPNTSSPRAPSGATRWGHTSLLRHYGQNTQPESNREKMPDKPKLRVFPQNDWPVILKITKVVKIQERLRNYSGLKVTRRRDN